MEANHHAILFLNVPTPAYFIVYFWSFQTNIITILQQIYVEKCPYGAGI